MSTPNENERQVKSNAALAFILAGNATFTARSLRTGARYTYKITESKSTPGKFFVNFLNGPDNEGDYRWMGMIFRDDNNKFVVPQKVKATGLSVGTPAISAFIWLYEKLVAGVEPPNMEIWHAGKCCRCGRKLTVPESIEMGIGPECATKGGF